jgi:hypothetical protein
VCAARINCSSMGVVVCVWGTDKRADAVSISVSQNVSLHSCSYFRWKGWREYARFVALAHAWTVKFMTFIFWRGFSADCSGHLISDGAWAVVERDYTGMGVRRCLSNGKCAGGNLNAEVAPLGGVCRALRIS